MKKLFLILTLAFAIMTEAQENKQPLPQISVSGEGKIKVKPDQVAINFGVENTGKDAAEVKKLNDETVDKVVKYIKKFGIPTTDFQTTNVSLHKNYDYNTKKHLYYASQNISILLKDVSKYDELMMGLMDNGINNISNIEFKSSKIEDYKSDARKAAMRDAKHKAEDYVSVLNQKVGKALIISDNSATYYPNPVMYKGAAMAMEGDASGNRETLAVGEIEVVANVNVSFILE